MTLELVKTTDILETLGKTKNKQFLVGFAAETGNTEFYAKDKLVRKNCDLIVANNVAAARPDLERIRISFRYMM